MLKIYYEDDDVLVVYKRPGLESQASTGFGADMVSEIKKHLAKHGVKNPYVGVVHRLDKPVSGVMVYAKNREAAAGLSEQFKEGGAASKIYTAVCLGRCSDKEFTLNDELFFDKEANKSYIVNDDYQGARTAKLTATCVACVSLQNMADSTGLFDEQLRRILSSGIMDGDKMVSLVRVKLLTGRHHQIRVQMAGAHLPVLGDVRYNEAFASYRGLPALCLCASNLSFVHPATGETHSYNV